METSKLKEQPQLNEIQVSRNTCKASSVVKYSTSKLTSSNTSNHVYAAAFQPPQARAQANAQSGLCT
jgi:hypothetical protein